MGHIDPQVGSESPKSKVIESIYTPITPIKILSGDTDHVKRLKDDAWVLKLFRKHKFELIKILEMPANNLAFVAQKSCA